MLKATGVRCNLNGFKLEVDHIEIAAEELVAVIGPNGSGKTTLAKVLSGFLKPDSGSIILKDKSIDTYRTKERARIINYMSSLQMPAFEKKVSDFILLGSYSREESSEVINENLQHLISDFGLQTLKDHHVTTLSAGELQRTLIAQALIQNSEILILDEPLSHLDVYWQKIVLQLLTGKYGRGKTLIIIIHDLNIAINCFKRVILLNNGRIALDRKVKTTEDRAHIATEVAKITEAQFEIFTFDENFFIKTW